MAAIARRWERRENSSASVLEIPAFCSRILGVTAHMAVAEGTPQTIQHQAVLERLIAEFYTGSQPPDVVRHVRHRLHAPGYDHMGVPCSNRLSRKHHRLQARSADLVDGDGRDGRRNPAVNRGLPGWGLALTCHDDVAHDHFVDTRRSDI